MGRAGCQDEDDPTCEERLMIRSVKTCLIGLALALPMSPALADDWRSTPWPSTSTGGNQFCFISYQVASRLFSVTAMTNGALLAITDPVFGDVENGSEVEVLFPSGWRISAGADVPEPGHLLIAMDTSVFHRVLNELERPGTLAVSVGGSTIAVTVPDQFDGRIRNLRGPLPEGSPIEKSCLEQLVGD